MRQIRAMEEVARHLRGVAWYDKCGTGESLMLAVPSRMVRDVAEVNRAIVAPDYEDAVLGMANDVTVHLHRTARDQYRRWNELTREVHAFIATTFLPHLTAVISKFGLSPETEASDRWALHAAIMTYLYQDFGVPTKLLFVLDVVRAGHLVAGWERDHKTGTCLVF